MEDSQIAASKKVDAFIHRCFDYICEDDRQRFLKKFREQADNSDQIMHTFRELVLGAHLGSRGLIARYDYVVNGQTPDWSILSATGKSVVAIIELTNFHLDRATMDQIEEQKHAKGMAVYWRDGNADNVQRLYHCIWNKASKYKSLVEDLGIPYVVAVFTHMEAAMDLEEFDLCLLGNESGLFHRCPEMRGVLFFEEIAGSYHFRYMQNPDALHGIELLSGQFPSEAAQHTLEATAPGGAG